MDRIVEPGERRVRLALEGGGALGAFTWGVLERLLEEPSLRVVAVSGASAGAMNGAMLVQGLAGGGAAAARGLLETFWHRVAIAAGSVPGPVGGWLQAMSDGVMSGPMAPMMAAMRQAGSRFSSPGGFGINPLRGILGELLHPLLFGAAGAPGLIVAATKVRTGEARLFRGEAVTIDALLASACLPMLFPAVEIEGEAYWDGGYSSNPPVRALIEADVDGDDTDGSDVLIVRTAPEEWSGLSYGAAAMRERINEITFGTPLRAELGVLARAQLSLAGVDGLPNSLARLRAARLHLIRPEAADAEAAGDGLHPSWALLTDQRARGRVAAERWLEAHGEDLGRGSSLSLEEYLERRADLAPATTRNLEGAGHAT